MKFIAKFLPALGLLVAAGVLIGADIQAEAPPGKEGAAAQQVEAKQAESYGDTLIVAKESVKTMFSHKSHVVTAGLTCDSCHPDLFERKRGAAKATGEYNHASFEAGNYCGACHDGSSAFKTAGAETCKTCHGSDMKQPETIVFTLPVKAVIFEHKGHVDMGLECSSCHDSAFEMRTGAAEQHPEKFTMEALYAGKYCGACHNGNDAFASDTRCTTCHIGVKGFDRMFAGPTPGKGEHKSK